jgi:hypothetical protein
VAASLISFALRAQEQYVEPIITLALGCGPIAAQDAQQQIQGVMYFW